MEQREIKFTGILDKNGEPIHNGDHVYFPGEDRHYIVRPHKAWGWQLTTPNGYTGLNPKYPPTLYKSWERPRDAKGHFLAKDMLLTNNPTE